MIKFRSTISVWSLSLAFLAADSLTIIGVGDIMMGTTYPEVRVPPQDGKFLFQNVDTILAAADLTLGNLEGPLLGGGTCTKTLVEGRSYAFRTPAGYVGNLVRAGFDFVNLANNHLDDFGPEGRDTTFQTLTAAGLAYGGPGGRTARFEIRGKKVEIVSFSFCAGTNSYFDVPRSQRIVAEAARQNDYIIVSLHGGGEGVNYMHTPDSFEYFLGWPRGNVVKFAHAVVDSGADLVWSHGPHVPRALELYRDRLIAYSLGNFCTWAGFNIDAERSYAPILTAVLDSSGVFVAGRIYSCIQRPGEYLKLDTLRRAARLMQALTLEDFPNSGPRITDEGVILPKE